MKNPFTKHFKLQSKSIDFFDIPMDNDIEVFICPFLIESTKLEIHFSRKVYNRLVNFFTELNKNYIKPNNRSQGLLFLNHLHEPNEIHFGYSSSNRGSAIAKKKANIIFDSLRNNRFAKQGLHTTNQAHNVLLLVKGIGQDIMSDIILNVCRDIFAEFTAKITAKHKIKNVKPFHCEFYDDNLKKWAKSSYILPKHNNKKVILVPKKIVSGKRAYSTRYNWFVSKNHITIEIMNKKRVSKSDEKLFQKLKNGTKKLIIKKVYQAYKKPKEDLIDFVINYPNSLDEFIQYVKEHYPEIDLSKLTKK